MSDLYTQVWRHKWPSVYHFAVAMLIARYSFLNGFCSLKQKSMARILSMSPSKVNSVLKDMEASQPPEIEIAHQFEGGVQQPSHLRLTLHTEIHNSEDSLVTEADFRKGEIRNRKLAPTIRETPLPQDGRPVSRNNESLKSESLQREILQHEESPATQHEDSDLKLALKAYNEHAEKNGWQLAKNITSARKMRFPGRLKQAGGLAGWASLLEFAATSRFLMGKVKPQQGRKQFRMDVDFLLQEKSLQSLIEGKYHDGKAWDGSPVKLNPATKPIDAGDPEVLEALRHDLPLQRSLADRWAQDEASWLDWMGPVPGMPGCVLDPAIQKQFVEAKEARERSRKLRAIEAAPSHVRVTHHQMRVDDADLL